MSDPQKAAFIGEEMIGEISAYPALPAVACPSCGRNLNRLFNTHSTWKYICLSERLLVAPGTDDPPVQAIVE